MADYSKLKNDELRRRIAEALGYELDGALPLWGTRNIDGVNMGHIIPNWPESDADALALLVEIPHEKTDVFIYRLNNSDWCAEIACLPPDGYVFEAHNKPTLARAVAEVFLAWKEAQNG